MIQNTLIKFAIALLILFTVTACYEEIEGQIAVNAFLEEMSPELARKINEIKKEILLTEEKISKLSELSRKHPNYAGKIETSRRQWEVLQHKLQQSLQEIRDVVESTYVTYELDRIQGGNQFNKISGKLLSSADSVLADASTTKDAIEQALNEVDEQPLPSLANKSPAEIDELPLNNENLSEITEEFTESKPLNPTSLPTNISCDAQEYLVDAHLNLMMMIISKDKTEQYALRIEIDKASADFEKAIKNKSSALQELWFAFKNTRETEIIPAIRAGNNDKALKIANSIQTERMSNMNNIIRTLSEDSCD